MKGLIVFLFLGGIFYLASLPYETSPAKEKIVEKIVYQQICPKVNYSPKVRTDDWNRWVVAPYVVFLPDYSVEGLYFLKVIKNEIAGK